jgi:hypothetical protein
MIRSLDRLLTVVIAVEARAGGAAGAAVVAVAIAAAARAVREVLFKDILRTVNIYFRTGILGGGLT